MGSMQSEEATEKIVHVHVIHGEEAFGQHPVAAPASLGLLDESDAPSEEMELDSFPQLTTTRQFVPTVETEGYGDHSRTQDSDLDDLDEPDVSFAYGSVGAPASMMDLEDLKYDRQTIKPTPIHKTKSEEMQMSIQKKEIAEIFQHKLETVCTQPSEGNIQRVGWLVLVNGEEPVELFTVKKESSDESSETSSKAPHSVSPLKSPKAHIAQASIEDISTTMTTEHMSEFSKSSSELEDSDPNQPELDNKTREADALGNAILPKKFMTHLNCAVSKHIPCGNGGMTKSECKEQGCCWKSFSRNLIQAGCFLPQSEVEANTDRLKKVAV